GERVGLAALLVQRVGEPVDRGVGAGAVVLRHLRESGRGPVPVAVVERFGPLLVELVLAGIALRALPDGVGGAFPDGLGGEGHRQARTGGAGQGESGGAEKSGSHVLFLSLRGAIASSRSRTREPSTRIL